MKIQLNNINDMNKTLKRVTDGDIVNGRYTIPDGVTRIGDCSFSGCISLREVEIPESVTVLGSDAFGGCDNLRVAVVSRSLLSGSRRVRQYVFPERTRIVARDDR